MKGLFIISLDIELQTSLVVFLVVWCHSGGLFCIILRKFAEIDLHIKYIKAKNSKISIAFKQITQP